MELPKYNGTIHPEKWLKQVQSYCCLKDIENEQKILKICKLLIDSTITIPDEVNSFDELIKTLKLHKIFNIFKDSCKRKLQVMKYNPEKEENYTVTFLANFHSLCNDAEINDLEEIKNLLINSYSNEFFKREFAKTVIEINSVDEILKKFSDVVFEELKIIKYDSLIALKHVTTGRYLSSCDTNYQTGSQKKVVFAGEKFHDSHALWVLENTFCFLKKPYQKNMVFYDDNFYLRHKETGNLFGLSYYCKSPVTGQSEAFCDDRTYSNSHCQFINVKSKDSNNTSQVKSKDIINLKTIGVGDRETFLRSHDFTFIIDSENFQEAVGHKDRIGGNDEWCIELVEE